MSDSKFIPVRGFQSFISLWYEACGQISHEYNKTTLDNDIKLFCLLRKMILTSEKPVFVRSYKLKDLNLSTNKPGTLFGNTLPKRIKNIFRTKRGLFNFISNRKKGWVENNV